MVLPPGAGFDDGVAADQAPAPLKGAKRDVCLGEAVKLCMLPVAAPPALVEGRMVVVTTYLIDGGGPGPPTPPAP